MNKFIEIGRVGGWRYLVVDRTNSFEVLRQDIKYDQVEESFGFARTFEAASNKAHSEIDIETARRHEQKLNFEVQERVSNINVRGG